MPAARTAWRRFVPASLSGVSQRAGIHRTTFYVHYSDIYGIIDEMETETIHNPLSSDEKLDSAEKRAAFLKKAFPTLSSRKIPTGSFWPLTRLWGFCRS